MRRVGSYFVALALASSYAMTQPPPPGTFGELQFPRYTVPPSCGAGRNGRVYSDRDDSLPYYCNGSAWTPFDAGFSISGTNPFLARFNSAGTNVETSDLRNTGVPAAGAGGSIIDLTKTLNAMDGSDTIHGFRIFLTNAAHSGAGNVLNGIQPHLNGAGSANATEAAYSVGDNWDFAIDFSFLRVIGANPPAATSGDYVLVSGTLAAFNGGERVSGLQVQLNNAASNHTGANNFIYGARFVLSNPEADATEAAINIANTGAVWDQGIRIDNAFVGPLLYADNTGGGDSVLFDSADSTPNILVQGTGTTLFALQAGKELTHLMGTDLSLSGTTLTIDPDANIVEVFGDGSDTVSIITAPTSTSHTERVTFICQDADVVFLDADAAGAAGTIDLAGVATNFTCSADDTLTMAYYVAPVSGNARWVEVGRSVN